MKHWEYKWLYWTDFADGLFEEALNELGLLGWELVSVIRLANGTTYYFKRPLYP